MKFHWGFCCSLCVVMLVMSCDDTKEGGGGVYRSVEVAGCFAEWKRYETGVFKNDRDGTGDCLK